MATYKQRHGPRWGFLVACALLAAPACSKSGPHKKAPVKGKVMLDDKPVTGGTLRFLADVGKGNTATVVCIGQIGPQGEYEAVTDRGPDVDVGAGVPLGWYKVVYVPPRKGTAPAVDAKYTDLGTSPLAVEVVENPGPGQYDITLK
jgi:hypothetical protein